MKHLFLLPPFNNVYRSKGFVCLPLADKVITEIHTIAEKDLNVYLTYIIGELIESFGSEDRGKIQAYEVNHYTYLFNFNSGLPRVSTYPGLL